MNRIRLHVPRRARTGETLTLHELAAMASMSRSHFSHTFHAVLGMSLRDYVRDLRLQRAHLLLLASSPCRSPSSPPEVRVLRSAASWTRASGTGWASLLSSFVGATTREFGRSRTPSFASRPEVADGPMLRKSGIDVEGAMPWGTHFCHFYCRLLAEAVPRRDPLLGKRSRRWHGRW